MEKADSKPKKCSKKGKDISKEKHRLSSKGKCAQTESNAQAHSETKAAPDQILGYLSSSTSQKKEEGKEKEVATERIKAEPSKVPELNSESTTENKMPEKPPKSTENAKDPIEEKAHDNLEQSKQKSNAESERARNQEAKECDGEEEEEEKKANNEEKKVLEEESVNPSKSKKKKAPSTARNSKKSAKVKASTKKSMRKEISGKKRPQRDEEDHTRPLKSTKKTAEIND